MPPISNNSGIDNKTIVIICLVALLILVALGVNILGEVSSRILSIFLVIYNFLRSIIVAILFNTGLILNASSDTVTDVTKISVDVGNSALHDIGNLLKGDRIDSVLAKSSTQSTLNPKPLDSNSKNQWCFVEKGKCIEIDHTDTCESKKTFSSQAKCLA